MSQEQATEKGPEKERYGAPIPKALSELFCFVFHIILFQPLENKTTSPSSPDLP